MSISPARELRRWKKVFFVVPHNRSKYGLIQEMPTSNKDNDIKNALDVLKVLKITLPTALAILSYGSEKQLFFLRFLIR